MYCHFIHWFSVYVTDEQQSSDVLQAQCTYSATGTCHCCLYVHMNNHAWNIPYTQQAVAMHVRALPQYKTMHCPTAAVATDMSILQHRYYLLNISGFDCIPGADAMLDPPRPRPLPPDFGGGDFGRSSSILSSNGSSSDSSFSNREAYTLGLKLELVNSGPTVTHPIKRYNCFSRVYMTERKCL